MRDPSEEVVQDFAHQQYLFNFGKDPPFHPKAGPNLINTTLQGNLRKMVHCNKGTLEFE